MASDSALLIFTKNPTLGKVKTRLAEEIGDKMALKAYMQLLKHTREITEEIDFCDCRIYYEEFIPSTDKWSEDIYEKYTQGEGTLQEKLARAVAQTFEDGYKKVAIMSPDCPELTTARIKQAFTLLNAKDVVIGPLTDGGYYLLGMKSFDQSLFDAMEFGTGSTCSNLVTLFNSKGLSYKELPETFDVDFAEDLTEKLRKLIGMVEVTDTDEVEEVEVEVDDEDQEEEEEIDEETIEPSDEDED